MPEPWVMVVAGTLRLKVLVPGLVTVMPPPEPVMSVLGVGDTVDETIETLFAGEPTVKTLLVKLKGGLISTVLPELMLKVEGASRFRVGVAEMV